MIRIKILLVDDQTMFREGLRTLISTQPDFEVVGEAVNGEEALRLVAQKKPGVVLMDLRMPVLDGVTATRSLHTQNPECKVIVLTTFDDDDSVFDGIRAGAVGYLLKDAPTEKLYEAIRAAAHGESFLQPSIAAKVVSEFSRLSNRPSTETSSLTEPLSEREIEVLRLVGSGYSNKQIASQLFIAEGTVKNHITSIFGKLEVTDRTQAALKAKEMKLI
jgi:DNA-binding NarL/FixJ family response regulator